MKLKTFGFSTNGIGDLKGTIVIYNDEDQPVGIEHSGNFSRFGIAQLATKASEAGFGADEVRAAAIQVLAALRT